MTVFVIVKPGFDELAEATRYDCGFISASTRVEFVHVNSNPMEQLRSICALSIESGDLICLAGVCPRHVGFQFAQLAKDTSRNYMPGQGINHQGTPIEENKIQSRLAIEKNYQTAWPYIMAIGHPESAIESFDVIRDLEVDVAWPEYVPDSPLLEHLLSVSATVGEWEVPDWFRIVDLSMQDLELNPMMNSTCQWNEWISFYPANKTFKLENHAQLDPIWLAGIATPLEHWRRG
jgi:hypothetical protein